MNRDKVHSYHNFLFPFKWELKGKSKRIPLSERASIKAFEKLECINTLYWEKYEFDFKIYKDSHTYNDYFYFYEAVRDVLNIEHLNKKNKNEQNIISGLQYQYKQLNEHSKYSIELKKDKEKFELNIADVLLNIYENGVGIITFQLYNQSYPEFEQILKINNFGRRVCPQYLGTEEGKAYTDAPKGNFLANSISITNTPSEYGLTITEDFSYYDDPDLENIQKAPFKIPGFIQYLIGQNFTADPTNKLAKIYIAPILDDRMFVQSFYVNSDRLKKLRKFSKKAATYKYQHSNDWYKYIYVDVGTASCHSQLLKQQLTTATYDRWIESTYEGKPNGQLYGICRYAFVVLVDDDWFTKNIISSHFQNIYFELSLLCLLQRTYIINFGNEVSRIAKLLDEDQANLKSLKNDISKLYLLYIKFINRIYFREVTPQEQGIELYNLLQKQMHIKEDLKELGEEIQELNSYVDTYEQGYLSKLATWFLPLGLVAGLLGMNTLDYQFTLNDWELRPTIFGIIGLMAAVFSIAISIYFIKNEIKK